MNLDFVEETTTAITSGTGAVTLTALQTVAPGTLRFSNILGTSTARLVNYVIEDITATAGKFEKGIGSVNNNVLTRTSVRETWDGATYLSTGATALNFGATPTSGNIRIRCAPLASSLMPTTPFVNASVGDDIGILSPSVPAALIAGSTFLTGAGGACPQYYYNWYWPGDGPIIQAAIKVTTNASTSHVIFGIYEVGSNGLPGRLLIGFNQMSSASTGVVKDSTTGTWTGDLASLLWLPPGWYYLSWQVSSASVAMMSGPLKSHANAFAASGPMPTQISGTYFGAAILKTAVATFGTLQNPATTPTVLTTLTGTSENTVPGFFLKPSN